MSRRFPTNVKATFSKLDDGTGYSFELRCVDGFFLTDGTSVGSKRDAREAAWRALEVIGLVVDE